MFDFKLTTTTTRVSKAICFALALNATLPAVSKDALRVAQSNPSQVDSLPLHDVISGQDKPGMNQLESIAKEAEETEGAIFVKEDQVTVKAPLLKALIELHRGLSPYDLDASSARGVTLRQVLMEALNNNLEIKISSNDAQANRWNFISSLGSFLPNIENQFTYQSLSGAFASPFGALVPVNSPYMTIPSGLTWTMFNGGANYFTARQTKHEYKAAKFGLARTTNDILLEASKLYYNLVLQDVLLQIRIEAVETSQALVAKNEVQYQFGANTQLDLLQAQTQLANDRQALISQQVARRKAAVDLAATLNLNGDEDLQVSDRLVSKVRLVDDSLKATDLVQMAIDNRPELKRWEQLRLAARDAIHVAYAPLLPQVIGAAGLATTGAKVVKANNASQPSAATTGSFGVGGFAPTTLAPINGVNTQIPKFNLAEIYLIGISVQWNIGGLGVTDLGKVNAARWQARKAQNEFARELTFVCREVRDAYLDSIDAENLIAASTDAVNSSRQQLKVAVIRLEEGVGTDLEVVNAQRNYTEALISKANSIVNFNQSQVKLLRAIGRISVEAVTSTRAMLR